MCKKKSPAKCKTFWGLKKGTVYSNDSAINLNKSWQESTWSKFVHPNWFFWGVLICFLHYSKHLNHLRLICINSILGLITPETNSLKNMSKVKSWFSRKVHRYGFGWIYLVPEVTNFRVTVYRRLAVYCWYFHKRLAMWLGISRISVL